MNPKRCYYYVSKKSGLCLLGSSGVGKDGIAVGQNSQDICNECRPIVVESVKEAEHSLCNHDGDSEHIDILGIQNGGQDDGVQNGDPVDQLQDCNRIGAIITINCAAEEANAQNDLNNNKDDLPHHGLLGLGQDQITDDAQNIADTTGNSAQ